MGSLLAINSVLLLISFFWGEIYSINPPVLDDNLKLKKSWELDVKKAKTLTRLTGKAGIIHSRKKRGIWPWEPSEEREEREEDREYIAWYCQSTCWGPWSSPSLSPCTFKCGHSSQRTRSRKQVKHGCACYGKSYKIEICGTKCQNGGTMRSTDCRCTVGYSGDCCETRVNCGNPGSPAHGLVRPAGYVHYYNAQVTYSCNSGWEVSGGTNPRRCQNNGRWSGSMPSCTRKKCPHPGTPQNGSVAPSTAFVFDTLVQFACEPGFSLEGPEISRCQSNQDWSHSAPTCNRVFCGNPGPMPHGTVSGNSYYFKDVLHYSCGPGFILFGSSVRECQADGTWSCDIPRCNSSIQLIPKCSTLNQIEKGSLTLSNGINYESVGQYSCDEGYYLTGESKRACLANRQWSGEEPTCNRISCPRLTAPANGQVTQPDGSPDYGSSATFTCDSGYRLDGDETANCEGNSASGTWSAATPVCQAVDCGTPDRPENGRIVGTDFTFQHKVQIQCGPGFFLQGPTELTCNENGAWVGGSTIPSCFECEKDHYKSDMSSAASCTKCPDNSQTASTASNNILQCTCDHGSEGPDGGPCSIVTCPVLATPNNGIVKPCGNEYRSVCELECNPGYIVSAGDLSRLCQASGSWRGDAIICSACPKDTYQNDTYRCARCPDNAVTSDEASVLTDCTCAAGFQSDGPGQPCTNIDECSGDNPCQQRCIDLEGSFRCDCISGYILDGLPDENPVNCTKRNGTCPAADLLKLANGGLACSIVNLYEEYCSPYCNHGYEILGHADKFITCNSATTWQWSHVVVGKPLPICTKIIFGKSFFNGTISYVDAECAGMTTQQKQDAESQFIHILERHRVCAPISGKCKVESTEIICGEEFQNGVGNRKKRQASTDTLHIKFNLTINIDFTECTEVNCQQKYDRLIQTEQQRITDELQVIIRPYEDGPGCPICILDPHGNPLQMNITGGTQVQCPDGHQQKGYSCRECMDGMFHNKQTGDCELCPVGQYQPVSGQTSCLSCPYLISLDKRGATKCPVNPAQMYDCQTRNPCRLGYKTYYSHTNARNYIQCSRQQRECTEKSCPRNYVWNPRRDACVPISRIPLTDIY